MDDSAKHPAPNASLVREIGDSPFCWQHKIALRKIRESFDAEKAVASAIGVYNALTEIASDEQMEIFTTTHAWIAQKSGLSPRTVQERLTGLAEIGLVEISTPIMKAPSTYRLLSVTQPLQNDKQPLQSVQQRTKKAPLLSLEESNEESLKKKENRKKGIFSNSSEAGEIAFEKPDSKQFWKYVEEQNLDADFSEKFYEMHQADDWTIDGSPIRFWQQALKAYCEKCETDRLGKNKFKSRRQSETNEDDPNHIDF